jgi:hypothetical protein
VTQGQARDDRYVVDGLTRAPGAMSVWGAAEERHAPGWQLTSVNLGLKSGRPLGAVYFVRDGLEDEVCVSVRWNHVVDQLECRLITAGHDAAERESLERDVRHRVGTYLAIYAEIGLNVGTHPVTDAAVRIASHLEPGKPSSQS